MSAALSYVELCRVFQRAGAGAQEYSGPIHRFQFGFVMDGDVKRPMLAIDTETTRPGRHNHATARDSTAYVREMFGGVSDIRFIGDNIRRDSAEDKHGGTTVFIEADLVDAITNDCMGRGRREFLLRELSSVAEQIGLPMGQRKRLDQLVIG